MVVCAYVKCVHINICVYINKHTPTHVHICICAYILIKLCLNSWSIPPLFTGGHTFQDSQWMNEAIGGFESWRNWFFLHMHTYHEVNL